jgi:hypothetical protein
MIVHYGDKVLCLKFGENKNKSELTNSTNVNFFAQMWKLRRHCLKMPNILPRLLDAVNWNSRDDLTHLYLLLQEWPKVN